MGVAPNLLLPGVGVSCIILMGVGCMAPHLPGVGVSPKLVLLKRLGVDLSALGVPIFDPAGVRSHLLRLGVTPSIAGVLLGVSHFVETL